MRWVLIAMILVGFVLAFMTRSPGVLGFGLIIGFIGTFGLVFSIAGARISENARPDTTMLQGDVLAAIRDHAKAKAARQGSVSQESKSNQI